MTAQIEHVSGVGRDGIFTPLSLPAFPVDPLSLTIPTPAVETPLRGLHMSFPDFVDLESAEAIYRFLDSEMDPSWWYYAFHAPFAGARCTPESVGHIAMMKAASLREFLEGRISYRFRRTQGDHYETCPCPVCKTYDLFCSDAFLDHVGEKLGFRVDIKTCFASYYAEGDFLSMHTDKNNGDIAFVWNLTKDWRSELGGNLVLVGDDWRTPQALILPRFNELVMFDVHGEGRPHYVSHVVPGVSQKRLAFSGWFERIDAGTRRGHKLGRNRPAVPAQPKPAAPPPPPMPEPTPAVPPEVAEALYDEYDTYMALLPIPEGITQAWKNNLLEMKRNAATRDVRDFLVWTNHIDMDDSWPFFKPWYDELRADPQWDARWSKLSLASTAARRHPFGPDPLRSPNSIQHAYHIFKYEQIVGERFLDDVDIVVEVGGGGGNFARMLRVDGFKGQHIIIDLPQIHVAQKLFLSLNGIDCRGFGEEDSLSGQVVLVRVEDLPSLAFQTGARIAFVATWSLSETPPDFRQKFSERFRLSSFSKFLLATQWSYEWEGIDNVSYFNQFMQDAGGAWKMLDVPANTSERYLFRGQARNGEFSKTTIIPPASPPAPAAVEKDPSTIYGPDWYREHYLNRHEYRGMADIIHAELGRGERGHSALDVGCGVGLILERLHEHGWNVQGVDGSRHAAEQGVNPGGRRILVRDLTKDNLADVGAEFFDLVICMEVAEHLEERWADRLVQILDSKSVKDGGAILFTAAIPGQGGLDHVNEQPNAYWIEKFAARGRVFDEKKTMQLREKFRIVLPRMFCYANTTMIFRRRAG